MRRIVIALLLGLAGCGAGCGPECEFAVGTDGICDQCSLLLCPESFPPAPE